MTHMGRLYIQIYSYTNIRSVDLFLSFQLLHGQTDRHTDATKKIAQDSWRSGNKSKIDDDVQFTIIFI